MPFPARPALVSLALAALAVSAAPATAAGADTFSSAEVTLRLVAEEPDADGTLRAALLVDLAPGWKTYWVDPGEAGVPPQIDLSTSRNVTVERLSFPAPHRFGDEYGMSNGYSEPMAVVLALRESLPGETTAIRAKVMLGVCQTICIPVSADLTLMPDTEGAADEARVAAAYAALPVASGEKDGIVEAMLSGDGKTLSVSAATSAPESGEAPDLFVAGPKNWYFGKPTHVEREGDAIRFDIPVLERPRKAEDGPLLVDAVMTQGDAAIERHALKVSTPAG